MSLLSYYTHSVIVKTLSHTENIQGGETSTWETSIESYACRMYKPSKEMEITDIGEFEGTPILIIGDDASIVVGDKFIDGTDEYIIKRVYKVRGSSSIHHIEMIGDKIK